MASTAQTESRDSDRDHSGGTATEASAAPPADSTSAGPETPGAGPETPDRRGLPAILRRRLVPFDTRLEPYSWLATLLVVAIAAILRLVGLSHPKGKIFDETYYAKDAWGLVSKGVEWNYKDNGASYVVHPPLGKWLIGIGEWAFGYSDADGNIVSAGHIMTTSPEFGWRFSAAIIGTLSVLLMVRTARRLFGSTVLGCAAGLLLALDGFHLVLSRTALLDIFLLFFIFAAFSALVVDRDHRRRRWLRAVESGLDPSAPGRAGRLPLRFPDSVPWWRLLAAVLLGCALGVKWSALYFVPVFALLVIFWEVGARRSAGVRRPWRDALLGEIGWLALAGVLIVATYIATWSGWFVTDQGYFRHWLADSGRNELPVIGALQNLWHYHAEAYKFHTTLVTPHVYQSWPWQWLLLGRPVAFYWSSDGGCGAPSCAAEILLLGTPILWWSFLPALAATAWLGIARRDWRAGAIMLCVAGGLLPWFWYAFDGRTMFSFYTAPALPFLILAVTYVLGAIIGPARSPVPAATAVRTPVPVADADTAPALLDLSEETLPADLTAQPGRPTSDDGGLDRRTVGAVIAGAYVLLVAICFAYFYPVFVGQLLPYAEWSARMWLASRWI
ncbi:phospholipid carrier-dependent glycosyltransferase [Micromonospora sp. NBC_01699]|uniref:dolichyl-phosphate-mannose--protein mannosyltransferase n=1 Tax=Micromonospora sp. NBC_01699 TaxID=2975984 RepID=UPI002E34DADC|nr:phospholipid carrier-dependent glycosyltransferase [Micromonospora sp. NBC_01699]